MSLSARPATYDPWASIQAPRDDIATSASTSVRVISGLLNDPPLAGGTVNIAYFRQIYEGELHDFRPSCVNTFPDTTFGGAAAA